MSDDRIPIKVTLIAMMPKGKSMNDMNEMVLAALGNYAKHVDPTWRTGGFKSIETRLRKETGTDAEGRE